MRLVDASTGAGSAVSSGPARRGERLCRPPCGRIIVRCPEAAGCCKDGWVHLNSMRHECPGSASVTGSGLVLYGSQHARPSS